ncbi:MAG TPA: hypothetical protein VHM00_08630 [Caldimonas sp.]|nr:hypothetical protein [Caldimonas sp.]HEX2541133.1 hypothetical protein [Caldimonas sp.]
MRRFLFLLMIIALPLRAVAGDVMAIGMATQVPGHASAFMPGCDMQVAGGHVHDDGSSASSGADCGACVLCVPFAQAPAITGSADDLSAVLPRVGEERFASAPSVRSTRPPSL